MLFYLRNTRSLFHGRHRSAFIANPWSGGISTVKLASFINCCFSFLGITSISHCSCNLESPMLTKSHKLAI